MATGAHFHTKKKTPARFGRDRGWGLLRQYVALPSLRGMKSSFTIPAAF